MKKQALIEINVTLDKNNIPDKIIWSAEDGGINKKETKACLISVWDQENNEALSLDLWTKKMSIYDMKHFFYQIFISLSKTYQNSIGEKNVTLFIYDFAKNFAKKSEIVL